MVDAWQGSPRRPWTQRSRVVYAVPGLALLAAVLLTWARPRAPVAWAVAAVLAATAVGAAWWWSAHDFATSTVIVTLDLGLLSSWWAYLMMAGAAAGCALQARSQNA